jgi:hypothetical protein
MTANRPVAEVPLFWTGTTIEGIMTIVALVYAHHAAAIVKETRAKKQL